MGFPSLLSAMLWPVETYVVLACKVSFIFIEIDLVAEVGDIIGSYFMGGEITTCLDFELNVFVKTNLIKFVLKFSGKLIFNVGTIVSFKPPVIVPLLRNSLLRQALIEIYFKLFSTYQISIRVTK
jgi:hypothetical protein